jgi:Ca-activated chloride channel family protein
MEFSNPWLLLMIPAILLPWLVAELVRDRRRTATLVFPAIPGRVLTRSLKSRLRVVPIFLRVIVLALLVVALAGPRVPSDEVPIYQEGIDIVVAFDISTSMKALDFEPSNRFEVARKTIGSFVEGRKHDRIGLVVFAGDAFTQCPLTLDHAVFRNILGQIRMDVIKDGTAIGDALGIAVNRLRDSEAKSKVIVLLTDGVNNTGSLDPEKAASFAKEFGVKIYSIQVGDGGQVPYPVQMRDPFTGQVVERVQMAEIPVNPQLLQAIASTTDGKYFRATDSEALARVFERIDQMERTELPGEQFVMYDELYAAFAFPALLLLLLELAIRLLWIRKFP